MNSDSSKDKTSLTDKNSSDGQISRRSLLVITAKSAAGLALVPLSSILANEQKTEHQAVKITMSGLLNDDVSAPFSSTLNANSGISDLLGDVNNDCKVDEEDLAIMSNEWLTHEASAMSNLDWSCTYIPDSAGSAVCIDFKDYSLLANDWGKSCSASSAISLVSSRRPTQSRFTSSVRHRFREKVIRTITGIVTEQL